MSYAYSYRKAKAPIRRPRGIAFLATIGFLAGIVSVVLAIAGAWLRMRQGMALAGLGGGLAIVLAIGLVVIWLSWGLWDMMRWAWWANLVVHAVVTLALGILLRYAPLLAGMLAHGYPESIIRWVAIGLLASIAAGMIFNLGAAIYLLNKRTAFGIGVRDRRPLWERRRF